MLDRPIRVCGMVRNEGEPGGGPFWVGNPDGTQSLQIAESSQISPDDMPLMEQATHFNPVDLVCGVRDSKGRKFDLRRYTDPSTGFISSKSAGGRDLRAQELPGLWNGAMARWNTVFVDVPITTFSPVKVAQELLENGYVTGRPYLGISYYAVTDAQTAAQLGVNAYGVYIVEVVKGGPADKAGLQAGDRIVSVDGSEVATQSDLGTLMQDHKAGDTIEITVARGGQMQTVTVTLGEKGAENN